MVQLNILGAVGSVLAGTLCAFGLLIFWVRTNRTSLVNARTLMRESADSVTFLFDDETLIDASPLAHSLLEHRNVDHSDWDAFLSLFSARFPELRVQLSELAKIGKKAIKPVDDHRSWIDAEYWNGLARITLVQHEDHPDDTIDPLVL